MKKVDTLQQHCLLARERATKRERSAACDGRDKRRGGKMRHTTGSA
jgi:hypothetical protein